MTETENVVQIGDLRLARSRNDWLLKKEGCQHDKLILNDVGDVVTCEACKVQVSAYWALCKMTDLWDGQSRRLKMELAKAKEAREAVLHLTAAKKVELAWRKRDTLPTCPHCRRGVLPEDGFGTCTVSKVFELGLRVRERAERVEKGLTTVQALSPRKSIAARVTQRPRSSTKPLPKWADAPVWAQWLTQGGHGKWLWHELEPYEQASGGSFVSAGLKAFAGSTPAPAEGKGSKQPRPGTQGTLL